ncbi:class I tRNA ligase family protein [Streptomyces sodiiphilus]|uniref:Class I tRNA ligase family protein n=1 Tax=Streptomyces sodiiphilus TaxID=226217 RepID=A0ABN2NXZ9_9ACTN
MDSHLWITTTPPAAHGELHIGHLAGPYVAADVMRRFLRADGEQVTSTTAIAGHTGSVELRALRHNRKPAEVAEGYTEAIGADWQHARIEFDSVVQPASDPRYRHWLQELFLELYADGVITPRAGLLPYCAPCERWLHSAHVSGTCPHCGAGCDGGICRTCARPNDGGDLIDPVCAACGTAARPRRCRRLHLALESFREHLTGHWAGAAMPPRMAALCEGLADDGLPFLPVGHPGEWGVPVPVEGFSGHRIDACFEAAAVHLYSWEAGGRPFPERSVHFCGFGHSFCQAVLFPVLLVSRGLKLPQRFCVNELYRLDGQALSTGARHAVWVLDLLTEYGSDALRRHVLQARPTGRATDFHRGELEQTRRLLDGTWNHWLNGLFAAVREECDGLVPDGEPGGSGWQTLRSRLDRTVDELRETYGPDHFDPRRAVALLDEAVVSASDFGHVNAHGRGRPGGRPGHRSALLAQLHVAAALAAWAWPVMPEGAGRLAAALRLPAGEPVRAGALEGPAPGTRIVPPPGPVFGI